MQEREKIVVSGLVALMLLLWLGFTVHISPEFAGSFWGHLLGISGACLMLVPLVYLIIKRVKPLNRFVTRLVPMRTLLAWHIYAGVIGAILVLLHTGHKFQSVLGTALTAMTLIVVISGFVGRYLLNQISQEIHEKEAMLTNTWQAYQRTVTELRANPEQVKEIGWLGGFFPSLFARVFVPREANPTPAIRAIRLTESIADLEYAVATHELFKKAFGRWLKFHIAIAMILYLLLGLHVWASIYYGIRWLQ